MKTIIILIILLFSLSAWSQDCNITTRVFVKELDYDLDTIDAEIYKNISTDNNMVQVFQKSEIEFIKEYPDIFVKDRLCFYFKAQNGEKLKACKIDTSTDFKGNLQYEFKGTYCNNALIFVSGYESWGYISVNLTDGIAFNTLGKPISSNCKTIYSYSNYYGEEEISILNVDTKKQLGLIIDGWTATESKHNKDQIYLKMNSMNCSSKVIHIKITIK